MDELLAVGSHHPMSLDSTKGRFVKVDRSRPVAYNQLRDELVLTIHDLPPDYWFLELRFIKGVRQFLRAISRQASCRCNFSSSSVTRSSSIPTQPRTPT